MELKTHHYHVQGKIITLGPLKENDWDFIAKSETDPVQSRSIDDMKDIYYMVSQNANCFIKEKDNQAIGNCWLQRMNLKEILEQYLGRDSRRIALVIGEKTLWSHGLVSM